MADLRKGRRIDPETLKSILDAKSKYEKLTFYFMYLLQDQGIDMRHLLEGDKEDAETALLAYLRGSEEWRIHNGRG